MRLLERSQLLFGLYGTHIELYLWFFTSHPRVKGKGNESGACALHVLFVCCHITTPPLAGQQHKARVACHIVLPDGFRLCNGRVLTQSLCV